MLVWINGAFGAGKTTVALGLAKRWPAALLFDPEKVGFLLRRVVPADCRQGDFQDLRLWRQLTVQMAAGLIEQHRRPLIVPIQVRRQCRRPVQRDRGLPAVDAGGDAATMCSRSALPATIADRSRVPAFPGSLTSARTSTSPSPPKISASGAERIGPTATIPGGVSKSEIFAMLRDSTTLMAVS